MPSQITGFLVNVATQAVTTTFALGNKITMSFGSSTQDPLSSRPPKNICTFGRLVVELTGAGSVTQVDCFLTWDAEGDHLAAGPFSSTSKVAALSATSSGAVIESFAFGLDQWTPVWPSDGTHPTLYLHVKTTGAGATVTKAYLYWRQLAEAM